ncbi:MAG TPA: tetratricopeptide repeat protein, partial [Candidatus Hydrogenedentes bacterium]|nr:tetratricopeptide repeat protein [Candidatus Hydrogenedentota bacterium]
MKAAAILRFGGLAAVFGLAASAHAEAPGQVQIDIANGCFQRGFYEDAAEEYRTYLSEYPHGEHAAVALYRLGESEYALSNYEAALEALSRFLSVESDAESRRRGLLRKGETLYRLERFDDAAATLEPLTRDADVETRCEALYYLGKTFHEAGNMDAAVKALDGVAQIAPDNPFAHFARYQLAFVYISTGQLENAAVEFSAVAESGADAALRMESRFRAAETYDKLGWFDAAVKAYTQLQEEFPGSDYAERAIYGHTWALFHAEKFSEALRAADRFVIDHPNSARTVGVRYLRGNCLQQQQKYDQALEVYREIRKSHPDSEFAELAYHKTAWVLYLKGDLNAAKNEVLAFLDAYKRTQLIGEAGFLLGTVEMAQGNYGDAYEEFRLAAEKYPNSEFGADALYKSAECLALLDRAEEAAKTFEAFARTYPGNPLAEEAILRSGDARFSSALFAEAVDEYKRILESNPAPKVEEHTLYRTAIAYHNMQNLSASAATFQTIIDKFPESVHVPEAYRRIGDYRFKEQNDLVKAIEAYQAAYDAAPTG